MFFLRAEGGGEQGRTRRGRVVAAKSKLWIYAAGEHGQGRRWEEERRRPGVGHSARGGSR